MSSIHPLHSVLLFRTAQNRVDSRNRPARSCYAVEAGCPPLAEVKHSLSGFTLIELLVTIAIIGILAGLALPGLNRAKESGRATVCLSNLRQIGLGMQLYVQENDNKLPVMYDALVATNALINSTNTAATNASPFNTAEKVLARHIGSRSVFRCPSDRKQLYETTGSSYSWNSLLNGQNADQLSLFGISFNPHQIPVFFDKESFHKARGEKKGVNFLYADGHIKNLLVLEGP